MFHLEMREGMHSVRAFNLTEEALATRFMEPLMADVEFTLEDHDWTPRKVRMRIFEGPQLRPDQLGMGRGWQTVERSFTDVTEAMLETARRQATENFAEEAAAAADQMTAPAQPAFPAQPAVLPHLPGEVDPLRERLIGRLSAGPVTFVDVVAMAAELFPGTAVDAQVAAAERAMLDVLRAGGTNLSR